MDVAVIGGTGMIGSRVVAELASRGHTVTSVSRKGNGGGSGNVVVLKADVSDQVAMRKLAADHDVIVSAIGPSREPGGDPSEFATTLVDLAKAVAGTRLVVVGGAGSLFVAPGVRLVDVPEFPEEYRAEGLASASALEALTSLSGAGEWSYLSPAPMITPGERTGHYVLGDDVPAGESISAEDYAIAVVDEVEHPAHVGRRFTVAN